jgi:hypothetical protein
VPPLPRAMPCPAPYRPLAVHLPSRAGRRRSRPAAGAKPAPAPGSRSDPDPPSTTETPDALDPRAAGRTAALAVVLAAVALAGCGGSCSTPHPAGGVPIPPTASTAAGTRLLCCNDTDDPGFVRAPGRPRPAALGRRPRPGLRTGASSGAAMSYRLAAALPGVFEAIAPVSGALADIDDREGFPPPRCRWSPFHGRQGSVSTRWTRDGRLAGRSGACHHWSRPSAAAARWPARPPAAATAPRWSSTNWPPWATPGRAPPSTTPCPPRHPDLGQQPALGVLRRARAAARLRGWPVHGSRCSARWWFGSSASSPPPNPDPVSATIPTAHLGV